MLSLLYTFFLHAVKPLYKEIESFEVSNSYEGCASSEIEQRSYYWLEVDNNSYVLYFDKSLEFHKRAFLLLVAVPGANKESWFDQSTCQLLADAFDNFYKKSCFFSFIPNKQSEKFYEFSINFLGAEIFGELEIEETITVVRTDSELKKMTVCSSLLEKVQIGTRFWNQFYKVEDKFVALFVETYYVLYQQTNENSETITLFRNADLIEIAFVLLQTEYFKGKIVVSDTEGSTATIFKRNVDVQEKNKYFVQMLNPLFFKITVAFELLENKNKQVKFLLNDDELKEAVETLPVEKLSKVGELVYLSENRFRKKVTVEVPIYYFGEKMELSKLGVGFRVIQEGLGGSNSVRGFILKFDFLYKQTCTSADFEDENYRICYIIESGKIAFKMNSITDSKENRLNYVEKETIEKNNLEQADTVSRFIDGIIIYNEDYFKVVTDRDFYKTKTTNTDSLVEQANTKAFNKSNGIEKSNRNFMLISLIILTSFSVILGLFCLYRKRMCKKERFKQTNKNREFFSKRN